jgi:hypothetical protein
VGFLTAVVERLLDALEVLAREVVARAVVFALALLGAAARRGLGLLADVDWAVAIWERFS